MSTATEICRHIRINGLRCGSPALAGKALCFYHGKLNDQHRHMKPAPPVNDMPTVLHPLAPISLTEREQRNPYLVEYYATLPGPLVLDIPPLEDRESIQIALSMLVTALAQNRIETRRATGILYGLQVASANARGLNLEPSHTNIVRDTVLTEDGQQLAPDEQTEAELATEAIMDDIARMEQREAEDEEDDDEDDD